MYIYIRVTVFMYLLKNEVSCYLMIKIVLLFVCLFWV